MPGPIPQNFIILKIHYNKDMYNDGNKYNRQ